MRHFLTVILLFTIINLTFSQSDTCYKPSINNQIIKASIIPGSLAVLSLATFWNNPVYDKYDAKNDVLKAFPNFHTKVDDYLRFTPGVFAYTLYFAGNKGKNDFTNKSIIGLKSEILMLTMVYSLKKITAVSRPDNSDKESYPSGHTAQAFLAAAFLSEEYGDQSIWFSIGGYTVATATGALRMMNNKHWLSDVLLGAGIGIFTTKVVYATHRYRWSDKQLFTMLPMMNKNGSGIYLSYTF